MAQPMRASREVKAGRGPWEVASSRVSSAIARIIGVGPQTKIWSHQAKWPGDQVGYEAVVAEGAVVGGNSIVDACIQPLTRRHLWGIASACQQANLHTLGRR